ncbi:MAG: hypothetical protein NTX29_16195 [Actinobacteria bacterium]|nr:hypothetical protein [Actinomycetota bacterium]
MTQRIPADLLRDMVREILMDVVESEVAGRVDSLAGGESVGGRRRETVAIGSQDDLNRAIRRILADAMDPQRRGAIEQGDIAFVLSTATLEQAPRRPAVVEPIHRVDKGAVTEKQVRAAADAGATIVTAHRVVITPLAKDKARSLGVVITRES